MTGIIRTNHKNNNFWLDFFKFTVVQSPENVLGTVTTKTEIECLPFSIIFIPCFFPGSFPTMSD